MSLRASLSNFLITFATPRFQMARRHRKSLKFFPNLRNPRRFTEELLWKKLYDKNPLMTLTSDKVAVRQFVEKGVGLEVLTELYGVYDRTEKIDFEQLPQSFVIKAQPWVELVQIGSR